ncbi:MAG: Na+/H+ antiporter subunit E [Sulfolobales archaeon]|nr:Na+/H+ antiporter subunit E [Sulfolobales archaeon]MCX8186435.1 Na+/H+ antiporter subunit E [Sulfolobales archaeon]MDW7969765.1 Na+/H+ antiporter subunit E [Sulfolobales archaeon]
MRLIKMVPVAALTFAVYIIFSGSVSTYDLILGSVVAVFSGYLTAELLISDSGKALSLRRFAWLVFYGIYYLTVAEFKAHVDVIKRIIHPKMPINPGIVRAPYNVGNDYSVVTVACSITNTPGTVVVHLDEGSKNYYVHWIDVKAPDPKTTYENIVKDFEKYVKKIFE